MISRVDHLTGATVEDAPPPCRTCMWWQTRPSRPVPDRRRFIQDIEDEFGPWGKLYRDDGRVVGLIQCGPASAFPRASRMPAGPPSRDAVIVTCAYLIDAHTPWVLQSLLLAVIGECKDRGLPALEAFAYRYPAEETFPGRFLRHRTIFPADFLRDFGFEARRTAGRIELARLDMRTLETVTEASRLEWLRSRLAVLSAAPAAPAAP
jgi:hypothetical protein